MRRPEKQQFDFEFWFWTSQSVVSYKRIKVNTTTISKSIILCFFFFWGHDFWKLFFFYKYFECTFKNLCDYYAFITLLRSTSESNSDLDFIIQGSPIERVEILSGLYVNDFAFFKYFFVSQKQLTWTNISLQRDWPNAVSAVYRVIDTLYWRLLYSLIRKSHFITQNSIQVFVTNEETSYVIVSDRKKSISGHCQKHIKSEITECCEVLKNQALSNPVSKISRITGH